MSYRVRISDQVYRLLYAEACETGLSIESVAELCIIGGIRNPSRDPKPSGRCSGNKAHLPEAPRMQV